MRIALCDGNSDSLKKTKQIIYEYANLRGIELLVEGYRSGNKLLSNASEYSFFILEYNLCDINGLETAKILRRKNPYCVIIFLSSYTGFIFDSFEVNPYRFLLKPLNKESLFAAFDGYFKACNENRPLWVKDGGDIFCLNTGEILYLEADNKNCFISLRDKKIRCHKTMAQVYGALPKRSFGKINRAYVVNFNYISSYSSDNVMLCNGERLHVGRSFFKSFKDEYKSFSGAKEL